mgnify:CR=1 FL=1
MLKLTQDEEGRKLFELHRSVNPQDVENAAWHFLCAARVDGLEKARAQLATGSQVPGVNPAIAAAPLGSVLLVAVIVSLVGLGAWRSLVAHLNGVQGVAGSNPVIPTA